MLTSRLRPPCAVLLILALLIAALPAGAEEGTYQDMSAAAPETGFSDDVFNTDDVPEEYLTPCDRPGRVEKLGYRVTTDEESYLKKAMVYLPAGYDDSDRRYNVLYMVHSAGGNVEQYLSETETTAFQCLLDHMIAEGNMEPVIFVAVSFYTGDEFEQYLPLTMQVTYTAEFPDTLYNSIIPAVEGKYRTYAESTDAAGIKASRAHRGIAGFSLGATAAWYTFLQKLDAVSWFLPISEASWDDGEDGITGIYDSSISARALYDALLDQGYGRDDFHLFVATGTEDTAFEVTTEQMKALLEYSDTFVTGKNTFCAMMIDGLHEFRALYTYMYHILPKLFTD